MNISERGECLLEILALTIRRDLLQEYKLDLGEMYTLLDYSDVLNKELEAARKVVEAARFGPCRHAAGHTGYDCQLCSALAAFDAIAGGKS